jgi:hypothetical protein
MRFFAIASFLFAAILVEVAVAFSGFSSKIVSYRAKSQLHCNAEEIEDDNNPEVKLAKAIAEKKINRDIWDGTRAPVTKMERLEQSMDASWGRGKFRTEVWAGDVNPSNDWWIAYQPSVEEVEASLQGYSFKNPKEFFEVRY